MVRHLDHMSGHNRRNEMNVLIKLLGLVVGMGAGIAANKALEAVWSKSTGKPAPKDASNLEDSLPGVVLFAFAGAPRGRSSMS
ncbi:hypothetical protein GCM10017710_13920 [Arthrobacter ramosus]